MHLCSRKVLIVDTEAKVKQALKFRFSKLNYKVFLSTSGYEAITTFNNENPSLLILDILIPELDGYEVCRKIRKKSRIPIIIVTSLNSLPNRIMGLELGATDYIIKPFSAKELEIKVQKYLACEALLSLKHYPKPKEILQFDSLTINLREKQVVKNKKLLNLTHIEYRLFELLIQNHGQVLSRPTLLSNVWGYTAQRYNEVRIVDVHIHRLRNKIENTPKQPKLIMTLRGVGYLLQMY